MKVKGTPYQTRTQPLNATLGRRWVIEMPCSIETVEVGSKRLIKVSTRWDDGTETVLWTTFELANFVDDEAHKWPESSDLILNYKGSPESKEFSAIVFMDWFTPCYASSDEALNH